MDRIDPDGLGRVRIRVPGLIEQAPFPFAFPMAVLFGGKAQRGWFAPPEKDAAVAVWFFRRDLTQPFYISAHWAEGEIPTGGEVTGDDTGRYPLETKAWIIEIDERAPDVLTVTNKATGDKIVFEGTARKVRTEVKDAKLEVDGIADKITVLATKVELGKVAGGFPALRKLIDDRLIPLFNAHTHLGNLGAPTSTPGVSVPPTTLVAGEAPLGVSTTRTEGN